MRSSQSPARAEDRREEEQTEDRQPPTRSEEERAEDRQSSTQNEEEGAKDMQPVQTKVREESYIEGNQTGDCRKGRVVLG